MFQSLARRACALFCLSLLVVAAAPASAQDELPKSFRACIDPNNLPFSSSAGGGIENRIAELFGAKLGVKVEFYAFPQRMGFIRNTLRYKLPGEDYRCDVVLGIPVGYDMVAATKPYYRSTWALVYVKGGKLDAVADGPDLFKQPRDGLKIGVYDKSPGAEWLARHGWEDQAHVYASLSPNPEQYPGEIIERDLLSGKIQAAVVWGPIAGYYAKKVVDRRLAVVPLKSESQRVRFDYAMAMGVRHGEPKWRAEIDRLIAENQREIDAILREYNVPLVDERGEILK
jgi:mxaJ protein